jgi:hypothetical protein
MVTYVNPFILVIQIPTFLVACEEDGINWAESNAYIGKSPQKSMGIPSSWIMLINH